MTHLSKLSKLTRTRIEAAKKFRYIIITRPDIPGIGYASCLSAQETPTLEITNTFPGVDRVS